MNYKESKKALIFRTIYEFFCGKGADINIFHFQYLATYQLIKQLKPILGDLEGIILDFGCGNSPYKKYLTKAKEYIGADIEPREGVLPIIDNKLPNIGEIDAVFSTQVLEHVQNVDIFYEVFSALKIGGKVVLSAPFLYHAHGAPFDFRRFTKEGIYEWAKLFGLESKSILTQGAIGSTITILFLSWLNTSFDSNNFTKAVKFMLLPLFIPFTLICNLCGIVFDKIDRTDCFYNNVILVAEKCR